MNVYLELIKQARKELSFADHITHVTLPIVKERKVFMSIIRHLHDAMLAAMRAYLMYERKNKGIALLPTSNELTFNMFLQFFGDKFLSKSDQEVLAEIKKVNEAYQKRLMDVKRGENYVIILPNYKTVIINEGRVKKYLNVVNLLISGIERVIG